MEVKIASNSKGYKLLRAFQILTILGAWIPANPCRHDAAL
jgi:hypothetical protein